MCKWTKIAELYIEGNFVLKNLLQSEVGES